MSSCWEVLNGSGMTRSNLTTSCDAEGPAPAKPGGVWRWTSMRRNLAGLGSNSGFKKGDLSSVSWGTPSRVALCRCELFHKKSLR